MGKYTDAKKASNKKWDANNLDRLSFTLPKGQKAGLQAAAAAAGESVNEYVQKALLARMGLTVWPAITTERDAGKEIDSSDIALRQDLHAGRE